MKQLNKQGLGFYPHFLTGAFWRGSLHRRGGACSRDGLCWRASDSGRQEEKKGESWSYKEQEVQSLALTTPTHSQISHPLGIRIHRWRRKGGRLQVRSICTSQSFHRSPAACRPSKTQQGSDGQGRTAFVIGPSPWWGRLKDGGY